MERIEAGYDPQLHKGRFWIFMWARFPDGLVGRPFSEDVLRRMVSSIRSTLDERSPSLPEELTEGLLQEKGDFVGLINYLEAIGEDAPVIALLSDRFAAWIDAQAESLSVGKVEFMHKFMNSFISSVVRF